MQNLTDNKWNFCSFHKITMLCLGLLVATQMSAQNSYQLIKTFPVEGWVLASDELKHAYVVNNENNILKLDSLGSLLAIYSENQYGEVSSIDATNPFEVLVFYKDYNVAISLDINMNAKQLYKFATVGINEVSAACMSYDNTIWAYDLSDNKLKKIDTNYKITHESFEVSKLLGGVIEPNYMVERDNMLYVVDEERGIFVFDMYGTYFRSYLFPGVQNLQIINRSLVFYKNGDLNVVDMQSQREEKIVLPEDIGEIKSTQVTRDYLMLLTKGELNLFKVTVEGQ